MSELNSCAYCHANNATNVVCSIVDNQYYSQEACDIFLEGVEWAIKEIRNGNLVLNEWKDKTKRNVTVDLKPVFPKKIEYIKLNGKQYEKEKLEQALKMIEEGKL